MQHKKTVTIKGVVYDIQTGDPIARSTEGVVIKHNIQRFATHAPLKVDKETHIPAPHHPVVAKVHAAQSKQVEQRISKPSNVIKQQAIDSAMKQTGTHSRKPFKLKKQVGKFQKILRAASASAMTALVAAYLAYLNMPAITTTLAANQAGIRATYPSYTPSGYALTGPVAYTNGIVSMYFSAKAAPVAYTVSQARSTWDSSAVRENYIIPTTGEKYTTTQSNGLTIYTFGQNAAWVNGGIFYTITGDAPLSGEQVQRIAVSM